jgi:aspartyl-tRNA(Asn)/glutamyl-tRNA(Gln) amidotransferase subunit A
MRYNSAFDNYFLQAQKLRNLVREDFDNVFRTPNVLASPMKYAETHTDSPNVDVLLHLSAIRTAPRISEAKSQGIETYVQDVLTVPASLAGVPAISIPAGRGADGWPVGVSLIGQWGCEDMVLRVSEVIEAIVDK